MGILANYKYDASASATSLCKPNYKAKKHIEKEIRYLPTFKAEEGTLQGFIDSVDQIMQKYGEDTDQIFSPNRVNINIPTTWIPYKE